MLIIFKQVKLKDVNKTPLYFIYDNEIVRIKLYDIGFGVVRFIDERHNAVICYKWQDREEYLNNIYSIQAGLQEICYNILYMCRLLPKTVVRVNYEK